MIYGKNYTAFSAALIALGGGLFFPRLARAAETPLALNASSEVLLLLSGVTVVYLLSTLFLEWLTRRYGFVTGVQYVLLGIIAVPMAGWITPEILTNIEPLVAIAVGAVGLTAGLQVNPRRLSRQSSPTWKLALTVTVTTIVIIVAVPLLILSRLTTAETLLFWMPAILLLGAVSLVADGEQITALAAFFKVESDAVEQAKELAWLSTLAALLCFGLLFSFYHPSPAWLGGWADAGLWLLAHLALGVLIGAVGGAMAQARPDDDRMLTILLGTLFTASSLAYLTSMSVIFVSFIVGITLINMSSESLRLRTMLARANRPLYILLLFFAGALWTGAIPPVGYLLLALYLTLRLFARILGVALYRPQLSGHRPQPGIHRALWAPGALTAAMILDFAFAFSASQTLISTTIISLFVIILIAEEVISFVLARGWMIDISDGDRSRRYSSPWSDWQGDR